MTPDEDNTDTNAAAVFNRWVDANMALPAGHYTHEQLRQLCWLSWMGAAGFIASQLGKFISEPPS